MTTSIPLKRARRHFPSRPSIKTIRKWIDRGIFNRRTRKRVKLVHFQDGGRIFLTLEAIEQFKREVNEKRNGTP